MLKFSDVRRFVQNAKELLSFNNAFPVRLVGFEYHLLQLVIRHVLSKSFGNPFEILKVNEVFLLRKERKSLIKLLSGILFAHFGSHYLEEVVEVNRDLTLLLLVSILLLASRLQIRDESLYFFLCRLKA